MRLGKAHGRTGQFAARRRQGSPDVAARPPQKRTGGKTVLVCVLKTRRDLDVLLRKRWYRIPAARMPARAFTHLAFYQPAAFGRDGKRIRYYARVRGWYPRMRFALLPDDPRHPRAGELYMKIRVGLVKRLRRPVLNSHPRRIVFGFTTLRRLRAARNILELFGIPDTERILGRHLTRAGIRATPQAYFSSDGRRCRLDFAVRCKRGSIAIECDNEKAHAGKRQKARDKAKDAFLERHGWTVLRFAEKEILSQGEACAARVAHAVNRLGGGIPRARGI